MIEGLTIAVAREATTTRCYTEAVPYLFVGQREDQSDRGGSDLGMFLDRTSRTSKEVNNQKAELSKRDLRVRP